MATVWLLLQIVDKRMKFNKVGVARGLPGEETRSTETQITLMTTGREATRREGIGFTIGITRLSPLRQRSRDGM